MKRIPLILSLALLLLLPAIALYPMLHASAKRMASIAAQPFRRPPRRTAPSLPPPLPSPLPPPLPSPSVVLSTPMIFPSPTASSRRFTAICPPTIPRWGT